MESLAWTLQVRARGAAANVGSSALPPRGRRQSSATYRAATKLGTAFITITEDETGAPLEAFINVGKAGSDTFAVAEALGRLVSLILRMPSPLSRRERAGQIVEQLARVGGMSPPCRALPDTLAIVLDEHLRSTAKVPPDRQTLVEPGTAQALAEEQARIPPPFESKAPRLMRRPKPVTGQKKQDYLHLPNPHESKGVRRMGDLRPEVKTAAQALGHALKNTTPLDEYAKATARLEGDDEAKGLLDELQRVQADVRLRQTDGGVSAADLERLRHLQSAVQAHPTIAAFIDAQLRAQASLRQVNVEISERLGVDFATLGRVSNCC